MEVLIKILQTSIPVFLTIALGMLCRKKALLSREGISALKRVAADIALPAVLFSAFATAEYSARSIVIPIVVFILCIFALVMGVAGCRLLRIKGKLAPYLLTGFEAGMLGYAMFAMLFPGESNASFAIIDLGQVLFVFTVYRILLTGQGGLKDAMINALKSPVIWSIVAGLVFTATGLYKALKPSGVSGIIDSVTDFIKAPTSVLILLTIGYDLEIGKIRWKYTTVVTAMRLVIMGVLFGGVYLLNKFALGSIISMNALILMLILPPPFMLPVFTDIPEERTDVSGAISFMTIVTIVLFAVMSGVIK